MSEGKTLELYQVDPNIVERVRDIANPATPIDNDAVRDLAQAWLRLQELSIRNSMAIAQVLVDMPPIVTFNKPKEQAEEKPAPR